MGVPDVEHEGLETELEALSEEVDEMGLKTVLEKLNQQLEGSVKYPMKNES